MKNYQHVDKYLDLIKEAKKEVEAVHHDYMKSKGVTFDHYTILYKDNSTESGLDEFDLKKKLGADWKKKYKVKDLHWKV